MRIVEERRPNGSKRVQMFCDDESLTRQEFKQECDLGLTIRRFCKTREGQQALKNAQGFAGGVFEDVSAVPDFQTARNIINRGKEVFDALPAVLRRRFENDPAKYVDFVTNPDNLDELRKLGLAKPVSSADAGSSTPPVKE